MENGAADVKRITEWLCTQYGSLRKASIALGYMPSHFDRLQRKGILDREQWLGWSRPIAEFVDMLDAEKRGDALPFAAFDVSHMTDPKLSEVWDRFAALDDIATAWDDLSDSYQQIVLLNVGKLCSELQIASLSSMQ